MVNRQDVPYSLASPEIGRPLRLAKIVFVGTKLAIERSRPKTTTDGMNCSSQPFSISQNRARHSLRVDKLNQHRLYCQRLAGRHGFPRVINERAAPDWGRPSIDTSRRARELLAANSRAAHLAQS